MVKMTLTFDNGPEPAVTHHVLDTLAAHGVKTTFFVIGKKLATAEGGPRSSAPMARAIGSATTPTPTPSRSATATTRRHSTTK